MYSWVKSVQVCNETCLKGENSHKGHELIYISITFILIFSGAYKTSVGLIIPGTGFVLAHTHRGNKSLFSSYPTILPEHLRSMVNAKLVKERLVPCFG